MKKVFLIIAVTISAFALNSCDPTKSKEYIAAQQEMDSLKVVLNSRDEEVNSLFSALTEIETNLAEVSTKFQKVGSMKTQGNENNQDARTKIKQQISDINALLEDNKQKLNSLNQKLKNSNFQVAELKKYVTKLESRIAEQDAQIQALLADLEKKESTILTLNSNISTLKKDNESKDVVIAQKTSEVNTAYYVLGTKKDLRAANLIDKRGGFIGIGRQTVLNENASLESFNKIDITQTNIIQLPNAKKAKIVTTHPDNSYELPKNGEGKYDAIKIINPQEFWRVSKYLVIVLD